MDMKKLILPLMVVSLVAFVNASVDTECQDNGFDFGIAKYQCGDTVAEQGSKFGDYNITVEWTNCTSVSWTSNPELNWALSKEGNERYIGTNPISKDGQNDISHLTFCDKDNQVPEFTVIGATIVLLGCGAFIYKKNKN